MPFTLEQFLAIFAEYNQAVYPMQLLLIAAAVFVTFSAIKPNKNSSKFISAILAFFWLWMGIGYQLTFFSRINQAAFIFGAVFIAQAIILFSAGVLKNDLSFHFYSDAKGFFGIFLVIYTLIFYPLLGLFFGHNYPKTPTFGLPCPTTIFTLGLFLLTDKKVPFYIWMIPMVWSLIGSSAVFLLGIYEDFGLLLAGFIAACFYFVSNRKEQQLFYFMR